MYRLLLTIGLFVSTLCMSGQTTVDSLSVDTSSLTNEKKLVAAEHLYKQNRFTEAANMYEALLATHGPDFVVFYNLGAALLQKQQHCQSHPELRKSPSHQAKRQRYTLQPGDVPNQDSGQYRRSWCFWSPVGIGRWKTQ